MSVEKYGFEVEVNPLMLRWGRETACYGVADASAEISVDSEQLMRWESGEDPLIYFLKKLVNCGKTLKKGMVVVRFFH